MPPVPMEKTLTEVERLTLERDRAQDLLKQAHDALMISPLGYHPRGAAHRVFCMLMDNLDIINTAFERQEAAKRAAAST